MNAQELATEVAFVLGEIKKAEAEVAQYKKAKEDAPFWSDEEAMADVALSEAEESLEYWKTDLANTLEAEQAEEN